MSALRQPIESAPFAPGFLSIWTPPEDTPAHRIGNPVRTPEDVLLDEVFRFAAQWSDSKLTPEEAAEIAARCTLATYWQDHVKPTKHAVKRNTLNKYAAAVSCWNKYAPRPAAAGDWPGLPIGLITTKYAQAWAEAAAKSIAPATLAPYWYHLRAIFKHAVAAGVIETAPAPKLPKVIAKTPVTLQLDQIEAAYRSLADCPELQVAFVFMLNTGMRPVDAFVLPWSAITHAARWNVTFTARKTGLPQCLPLANVTVSQLKRLPGWATRRGSVFPSLGNAAAKDPERSRPARRRRKLLKSKLAALGIHCNKPHQVSRATCNTRLETYRDGVGRIVLGHAGKDVNTNHYLDPGAKILDGVCNVPQPPCFFDL